MGKVWSMIQREQKKKDDLQAQLQRTVRKDVNEWFRPVSKKRAPELNLTRAESRADPSERIRVEQKFLLSEALKGYEEAMQQDAELAEIFRLAKEYSEIQATSVYGDYAAEAALATRIYKNLKKYQALLDEQALTEEGDTYSFYERQVISANLFSYFERQRDGDLTVPRKTEGETGLCRVDGVRRAPQSAFWRPEERQDDDAPLFTHEPNSNDINQGSLGDCYLLSSLSSIASTHPEKIREAMHDEGNGKVTVRFFARNTDDSYTPVFVTVEKVVPKGRGRVDEFAKNSLWVQTFERAWAASGLQAVRDRSVYGPPVPENVDEIYNRFREQLRNGRKPTRADRLANPWVFDEYGDLTPWKPTYAGIEGGYSAFAVQSILGPGYSAEIVENEKDFDDYLQNGRLDFDALGKESLTAQFLRNWDFLHPGEPLNPQQREQLSKELDRNAALELRALYEAMHFQAPVLDETGSLSRNDPNFALTAAVFAPLSRELQALNIRTERELENWFVGNPQNTIAENVIAAVEQNLGAINDAQKAAVSRGVNAKLEIIRELVVKKDKADRSDRKLDGVYDAEADELFRRIEAGEQAHFPMTCGTKEAVVPGLVRDHAYSLCGVRRKKIGGKEFRFVTVRNPWGSRSRTYELRDGELQGSASNGTGGFMELELNDYLNNFCETQIAGPSEKEKVNRELEETLTRALEEYRDVEITERTDAGQKDLQTAKKFRLGSVTKTELGGVERTFVNLIPEGAAQGASVRCPIEKFYEKYNRPQVGEINLEKEKAAFAQQRTEDRKLKTDRKRSAAENEAYARKQKEAARSRINQPQPKAEPKLEESESSLRLPFIHALGNLRSCFAKTEGNGRNGSAEYYHMRNALNQMLRCLETAGTSRITDGMDAAAEVSRTVRDYLRHCEAVPRSGARRAERVLAAKKLLVIAKCFEDYNYHPQETLKTAVENGTLDAFAAENLEEHPVDITPEGLRRRLAGMLADKFAEIAQTKPDRKAEADQILSSRKAREAAIDSVRNSACFRSVYDRMDSDALQKDIRQGEETVYIKVAKEYNRLEKLAKKAAAHRAPVRNDAPELQK